VLNIRGLAAAAKLDSDPKTRRLLRQTTYLFIVKGASALISLLMVPLLLSILSDESYGIWVTLLSTVAWFSFFDVGLGNGLRNKLTESLARGQAQEARSYISNAYFMICVLVLIIATI
jgi:O-antigen/teichoic acid export membrane protein